MIRFARNFVDSIASRIILIIIVSAFLFYGILDALRLGMSDDDAIKFKFVENVKLNEFFNLKNAYIRNLSSQNINVFDFTEEESRQIDSFVLEKLINNRSMKYLSKLYNLQVSEEFLRSREKDFKNAQILYLANYLKETFAISEVSEMFNAICIQKTFMNSYANSALSKEMHNFFNEVRIVDDFYIGLDDVKIIANDINDSDIENFYNENKNIFTTQEKRSIEYVFINFNTDETTKFNNIKKIDDEIASGKDLEEIASIYNQKVINLGELTFYQAENHKDEIIKTSAIEIFDLAENETSYPKEIDGGVLLFKAKSIKPSRLQDLSEVKNIVFNELVKKKKINEMKKVITNFKEEASLDIVNIENISKKYNIKKVESNIDISRNDYNEDLEDEIKYNAKYNEGTKKYKNIKKLAETNIFETKLWDFSNIYIDEGGVGIFLLKESKVVDEKVKNNNHKGYNNNYNKSRSNASIIASNNNDLKNKEHPEDAYNKLIQISIFEDLLHYVKNINNIKINKDLNK